MLQTFKGRSVEVGEGGYDVPPSAEPSPAEQFSAFIGFVRRRLPIVLSMVPLAIGLAAVYLFTTPPLYEGRARFIIDTGKIQVFKESILGEDPVNLAMIDSQIEILRSENFALSVIKKMSLVNDPEFVGSGGGLISKAKELLHLFGANKPKSETEVTQRTIAAFEDRLTVTRVPLTFVVEIAFQSTDPDRAAQIANAVADTFILDQLEARYDTVRRAMAWLQDRLNELRGQVSTADRAVIDYKATHNIVDTGGHLINDQQLTDLNTALIKSRADFLETLAKLNRVLQILGNDNFDPTATETATVTNSLHNEIITKLRQQYLELAQREALFSNRYGHDHLAVVNLRNQMREIHRSIGSELRQIAEAYKSDYDIAKAREDSIEKSLAASVSGSQTASKAQIELRQLESAAQTYRTLYDSLQQRYTETVQQQSLPITETRVITRASAELAKISPKSIRTLAVATLGGLVIGFGRAYCGKYPIACFGPAAKWR